MRILFTGMDWLPHCGSGGLDRYFYENIQAMSSHGHTGTALVSYCEAAAVGNIVVSPMAHLGASRIARMRGARRLATAALRGGVDVINAHFALYAYPWLAAVPGHVPFVVNFQGPWSGEMRVESANLRRRILAIFAERIEWAVYHRADRLITLSEAFRDLLHQKFKVPLDRIRVIPGALHLERYFAAPSRSEARQQLGWASDRPTLVSVRRLAKRMGLDNLIEAIVEVRKAVPNVLLLIGGKGPEADSLKAQIAARRLQDNVRMLGFISEEELPLVYAAADLSIVPTLALEGFGLVTAESLACGTPVLGTPIGATPELLLPLQRDLVFESPSPADMASRIEAVLLGKICVPDREACRTYVERYGWPAVVPRILDVYADAATVCKAR